MKYSEKHMQTTDLFHNTSHIHVMAQIFKSGDLSNLIRSLDSISGGFLSNYFNAR